MGKLTGKNGEVERENSKYQRNDGDFGNDSSKSSKDKKLKHRLRKTHNDYKNAINSAAATDLLLQENQGLLEAEHEMEKTFKFKQKEIKGAVDQQTAQKALNLKLDHFGPYTLDYSRNGTHLLIGGRKGHVALMDWRKGELKNELHLGETVNAVRFLQNEQFFAVAQKKYTFIYDHDGTELHRMKQHIEVKHMEFLPYHYLLATAGNTGFLKYQDVSTGVLVNEIRTKLGPTTAMTQNPWNAIMHLGSSTGLVSLWSPNANEALVKIQCASKSGPIKDISIDRSGHYMAVANTDKSLKIYDVRTYKELYSYDSPTPASSVEFSDTGLLSVSWGGHVTIWKDVYKSKQNSPYMNHMIPGSRIEKSKFVPFEDLLGLGHSEGVQNIIVPGSGEANFDALELNPYESTKQRQESEVRSLMNKLPADSISLNPNEIGTVQKSASQVRLKASDLNELSKKKPTDEELKLLPNENVKGKNSALRRHLRKKQKNVIDERRLRIEANLKREKELRQKKLQKSRGEEADDREALGNVLSRFK